MLVANLKDKRIVSFEAERSEFFTCPECDSKVILKKGKVKIPHFAHHIKQPSCTLNTESFEHLKIKEEIYKAALAQGICADLEHVIDDTRTDVALFTPKRRIAVEIQLSPIDTDTIIKRMRTHTKKGFSTCWIHSENSKFFDSVFSTRVPEWVRYIHQCNYGVVFKHLTGLNLKPIHFKTIVRYGEEYYVKDGHGNTEIAPDIYLKSMKSLSPAPFIKSIMQTNDTMSKDCLVATTSYKEKWW